MNRRPAGVVVAAIVLGLATLMLLFFALGSVVMAAMAPHMPAPPSAGGAPPPPPGLLLGVMLFSAVFYLALAGWGGATLAGLVRMRPWARVSVMIIGGGLVVMGLLGVAGSALTQAMMGSMALPPGTDPRILRLMFLLIGAGCLAVSAVGVWWLVYFALRRTRAAFRLAAPPSQATNGSFAAPHNAPAGPVTDFSVAQPLAQVSAPLVPESPAPWQPLDPYGTVGTYPTAAKRRRPVSITVIAVLLLIGSFFALLQMTSSQPVFLFSVLLSGWPAHVTMLMWCAVSGVAGLGLTKLQRPAWMLAIGLFSVTALNGLSLLLPGSQARFSAYMQTVMSRSWACQHLSSGRSSDRSSCTFVPSSERCSACSSQEPCWSCFGGRAGPLNNRQPIKQLRNGQAP